MFSWFRSDKRRKKIREDKRYLEARARRLLERYLVADNESKKQYYEVLAGAVEACQPGVSDPRVEDVSRAKVSAEAALKVVKLREHAVIEGNNYPHELITDAYATVAIAYRRAAAVYTIDENMQQLGTAAVHLVTIANSYMAAQSRQAKAAPKRE